MIRVDNPFFLLLMVAGPALARVSSRFRPWCFLLANGALYSMTLDSSRELLVIAIIAFVPFAAGRGRDRYPLPLWPFLAALTAAFIVLNGYSWYLLPPGGLLRHGFKLAGLSYIYFRQLDYLVQVFARHAPAGRFVDYLNYVFSFWTILAGPIQRYRDYYSQLILPARPEPAAVLPLLHRASTGLLKILVLGALCKSCADHAYQRMLELGGSWPGMLALFYGYPLYVYFNFSGYCDFVIAMAAWAGIRLPENFDAPWRARDMIEFWNRWHISLSGWIREYVYFPMLKTVRDRLPGLPPGIAQYSVIFLVFFLMGIWHGTTVNYVVLGLVNGFGLSVSLLYRNLLRQRLTAARYVLWQRSRWITAVERIICLHFVFLMCFHVDYDLARIGPWAVGLLGGR